MLALALQAATKTLLENHIYVFDGQLYRQVSGGPIGDNVTLLSSDMVMFEFADLYKKKLMSTQQVRMTNDDKRQKLG